MKSQGILFLLEGGHPDFRILCSLFFNKYVSVCHPSDRDLNWRPAVQEETFPMQVKEHDNNLHDYL